MPRSKPPARAWRLGFATRCEKAGEPGCVNRAGSLLTMFLGPMQVRDADEARTLRHGEVRQIFPWDA